MVLSKEEAIAEIQRIAKKLNQDHLKQKDFKKYSKIKYYKIIQKFENKWNKAVSSAGLKIYHTSKITKEEAIAEIQRIAKKLNQDHLSQIEYRNNSNFSIHKIKYKFDGSWNAALRAAGLRIFNKSYNKKEAIADLQRIARKLGQNYITMPEYDKYSKGTSARIRYLFEGSWSKAIEAAGLNLNRLKYNDREALAEIKRITNIINQEQTSDYEFDKYLKMIIDNIWQCGKKYATVMDIGIDNIIINVNFKKDEDHKDNKS